MIMPPIWRTSVTGRAAPAGLFSLAVKVSLSVWWCARRSSRQALHLLTHDEPGAMRPPEMLGDEPLLQVPLVDPLRAAAGPPGAPVAAVVLGHGELVI